MLDLRSDPVSDNVLQTLQKLVQDVLAPEVRETKVRVESLAKEMETRFGAVDTRFDALTKEMDTRFDAVDQRFKSIDMRFDMLEKQSESQYKSILAAIAESKAHTDLANMSEVYALRERVAVLEAKAA